MCTINKSAYAKKNVETYIMILVFSKFLYSLKSNKNNLALLANIPVSEKFLLKDLSNHE